MTTKILLFISLVLSTHFLFAQNVEDTIITLQQKTKVLKGQLAEVKSQIDDLKLKKIREDLDSIGLPKLKKGEEVVNHLAYSLVYSEKHEEAKWVAHIILPDIINGVEGRSNDFRPDPLIKTGSAVEQDYFLKHLKPGTKDKYIYDGFGYDRGHLAPSADFRWSKKALSESFYYSNMTPQLDDFNRKKWADLEGLLRGYIYDHPHTQLYIVTGPILEDSMAVIERGVNKVSIPKYFFKVALDLKNKKAIGFIMPNIDMKYPVASYAVTIDSVEKKTGLDFFYKLDDDLEDELESQKHVTDWVPKKQKNDVDPIYQPSLPSGTFNTVQAKRFMGLNKKITVRGTVVGGKKTRNGHLFFNLDKNYPNQIFTVAVWKKNILNFSYDPLTEWKGKTISFRGKIANFDGIPTMIIEKEQAVEVQPKKGKMIMVIGGK